MERNHFRPRDFTCYVGISNPFPLCSRTVIHVPVTKCSDLTVPLVDAEVNKLLSVGAIKAITFSKENSYSRLFLVPKKEGTLPPCNRPQPAQQVFRPFHAVRYSVPLALYAITLKLHETYVQFFPSSKPDPLFVSCVKPCNPIAAPTLRVRSIDRIPE